MIRMLRWFPTLAACALSLTELAGCIGTHTGNPDMGDENLPVGADLVRSNLKRETAPAVPADSRSQLATDNQDFAFELYAKVVAERGDENLLISPYSISVGLAMAYAGTAGQTKREIEMVGHFGLPEPTLHAAFNATNQALESRSQSKPNAPAGAARYAVTNAMFAQKHTPFHEDYLDLLGRDYDAGIYRLDFADVTHARSSINAWVAQQTEHRVKELLPVAALDAAVQLVLVNTVYFKANWELVFDPEQTIDGAFHAAKGDVTVPMMHGPGGVTHYRYAEADGYQAVELALLPNSVRMLFLLPSSDRFDEIEANLDRNLFANIQQALKSTPELFTMPRFGFDSASELTNNLKALGMQEAFGTNANFSRMSDAPLHLDSVRHQTFIAVDEKGVEAAAASAYLGSGGTGPQPRVVALDRPFLFLIYDAPTNQLLFIGRLMDPS